MLTKGEILPIELKRCTVKYFRLGRIPPRTIGKRNRGSSLIVVRVIVINNVAAHVFFFLARGL